MTECVMYGLVSDQAAANLLPVMQLKPQRLVLFHSGQKKYSDKAKLLSNLIKQRNTQVSLIELDNDHDYEATKAQMIDQLAELPDQQKALINVTGGTKLQAMALQDASSALDAGYREVIYLDIDSGNLIRLDKKQDACAIDVKIALKDYLQVYGIHIEKTGQTHPNWKAEEVRVFDEISKHIPRFQPALTRLNAIAAGAEAQQLIGLVENPDHELSRLIDLFAELGKLQANGNTIKFATIEDLNYVKGGWLEHFVFQAIADVSNELGITDKLNSVEFSRSSDSSVRNEVDSLFMCQNRVYVVECKTSKMKGDYSKDKANDQLHKLANLSLNIGGLGAKSAFVSFQTIGEFEKRLAKQMGIAVIHGNDLKDLKGALKKWIRPTA